MASDEMQKRFGSRWVQLSHRNLPFTSHKGEVSKPPRTDMSFATRVFLDTARCSGIERREARDGNVGMAIEMVVKGSLSSKG